MTHKSWIIKMNDEMMMSYLVPLTLEWINSNSWGHNNHWTCTNNNSSSNTTETITNFIKCKQQQTNSNKRTNNFLNSNNENKESISCRADVEQDQFLQFIRFNHVQVKKLSGNNESIIIDVIVLCSSKKLIFYLYNFTKSESECDECDTWYNILSHDFTWCQKVSIICVILQNFWEIQDLREMQVRHKLDICPIVTFQHFSFFVARAAHLRRCHVTNALENAECTFGTFTKSWICAVISFNEHSSVS